MKLTLTVLCLMLCHSIFAIYQPSEPCYEIELTEGGPIFWNITKIENEVIFGYPCGSKQNELLKIPLSKITSIDFAREDVSDLKFNALSFWEYKGLVSGILIGLITSLTLFLLAVLNIFNYTIYGLVIIPLVFSIYWLIKRKKVLVRLFGYILGVMLSILLILAIGEN